MGYGNGMEAYVEYVWPESDLEMIQGTLPLYQDQQPFCVYYMTVSGHSPYSSSGSANVLAAKHWDRVKDLPYSDTVKAYIAGNLELEDALTYLVDELEKTEPQHFAVRQYRKFKLAAGVTLYKRHLTYEIIKGMIKSRKETVTHEKSYHYCLV